MTAYPAHYTPQLVELLSSLNQDQAAAVAWGPGPAALLGSPGAGKTRTIVARIARLVYDGIEPKYILAMTFTRAAAAEMNERLRVLGITEARVGTIHSVCNQILGENTWMLQRIELDERNALHFELKKLLSDLRKEKRIPRDGVDLEAVSRFVGACKAAGPCYVWDDPFGLNIRTEPFMLDIADTWSTRAGLLSRSLLHLYTQMERRRAYRGLFSYDDMLLWAWMALITDDEARLRWRSRYSVVIVDEVQDSNAVQWDLSYMLTGMGSCIEDVTSKSITADGHPHSLMVTGDINQSIFGWRHAKPKMYADFCNRKDTQIFRISVSYRNHPEICSVASEIVKGKPWNVLGDILPFDAHPMQATAVSVIPCGGLEEEARVAVAACQEVGDLRQCAILARLSVVLQLAELECIRRRMPYIMRASGSFCESREVKDMLAYLRVACGTDTDGKWLRHIINTPFRMIGKPAIEAAITRGRAEGTSVLEMLLQFSSLSRKQLRALEELYNLLFELRRIAEKSERDPNELGAEDMDPEPLGPAPMIAAVMDRTAYVEELRREEGLMGMTESRLAILSELQRIARMFRSVPDFVGYMDHMQIAVRKARKSGLRKTRYEDRSNALVLSTIHSAKGLEWDYVWLIDVNKGRFPCSRAEEYDEELRLLYVAITRAAKQCSVTYTKMESIEDHSPFKLILDQKIVDFRKRFQPTVIIDKQLTSTTL
jgi:DNA helicase-2/ATP-dependent DNA helicase PcrA